MAKIKVEVTNAVVSGKTHGGTLVIDEVEAKHLESIGYVKLVKKEKVEKE